MHITGLLGDVTHYYNIPLYFIGRIYSFVNWSPKKPGETICKRAWFHNQPPILNFEGEQLT